MAGVGNGGPTQYVGVNRGGVSSARMNNENHVGNQSDLSSEEIEGDIESGMKLNDGD
jgi:hypothetical protein